MISRGEFKELGPVTGENAVKSFVLDWGCEKGDKWSLQCRINFFGGIKDRGASFAFTNAESVKRYHKTHNKEHCICQAKYDKTSKGKTVKARSIAKRKRELGFESINEHFPGGVWHHINENDVICIPEELHQSIYHNQVTGQGMIEINDLAMEFLLAELGEC